VCVLCVHVCAAPHVVTCYCVTATSSIELNVTISPDYTPAPGEAPEELSANEFTAGSVLYLTCITLGGSGNLTYNWSLQGNPTPSECDSCATPTSSTATLALGPPIYPLYSYYAGTYTCTVSESGRPSSGNSDSHTVTVVGECHGVCACVCSVQ